MDFLKDHSIQNELLLIFFSVLIGLCIGAEREYRNKSAGLRTFILVCFGACLFTILSIKIGVDDPDRIAANIITGIGFLGAGVIFKGDNKIDGITTATTIWATASIGMAIGSGYVYLSVLGTFLVLLVLSSLHFIEKMIDQRHKISEYKISVLNKNDLAYSESLFTNNHLKYCIEAQDYNGERIFTTYIITGKRHQHEALRKQLMDDDKITSYQF